MTITDARLHAQRDWDGWFDDVYDQDEFLSRLELAYEGWYEDEYGVFA